MRAVIATFNSVDFVSVSWALGVIFGVVM